MGKGKHFRKSQSQFPSLFAVRAGRGVMPARGLAGICMAPGVSLEADGTSLQQPAGPGLASAIPCSHTGNPWPGRICHEPRAITTQSIIRWK